MEQTDTHLPEMSISDIKYTTVGQKPRRLVMLGVGTRLVEKQRMNFSVRTNQKKYIYKASIAQGMTAE